MDLKECFGQVGNTKIHFNNSTQKHYLRVDEEKMKECNECHLFARCMFLRYNELMQEMLRLLDESGSKDMRPKL